MKYMRGKDRSKKDGIDILEYIHKELQESEGNIPPIIVFERGIPVPYEETEEIEEEIEDKQGRKG